MIDKILKGYENLEKASLEAQKNEIEKTKEIEKLLTQESDERNIMEDIQSLQVMPSTAAFNHTCNLFFDKWSEMRQ